MIEFTGYGYRRVTIELQNRGHPAKEEIVRKFMKEDNLLCVKKRFRLRTTDSNHGEKIYPNLASDLKVTTENSIRIDIYQMPMLPKLFSNKLNVVIIVKTNLKTLASSHVVLFSSDLDLENAW